MVDISDEPLSRTHLPQACGVYIMRDASQQVIYVGKANNLAKRVAQYFLARKQVDRKTAILSPLVRKIDYIACASERESLIWERKLILKYKPFFNAMWKDDKSYPYIKISMNEDFPRIFMTRKKEKDGAVYFGPYPKVSQVRNVLKYFWQAQFFPLRPCKWEFSEKKPLTKKKIMGCLYYHTRQCPAPCAARLPTKEYRDIAQNAALFFRGEFGRLRKVWEEAMKAASARMDYEAAAQLKRNIDGLTHMAQRVRFEALTPEFVEQRLLSSHGVTELQQALSLAKPPHHMECFDISHFSGKEMVGSMVCFEGGEANKDHYRRFKIRHQAGNDDFLSMKEVVWRRYSRLAKEKSKLPDLILIDGGKGQLSMARQALDELGLKVPLAALAKENEELFLPGRAEPIVLTRDNPALQLVQRIRDEAHRFAVKYHTLLRRKRLFSTAE